MLETMMYENLFFYHIYKFMQIYFSCCFSRKNKKNKVQNWMKDEFNHQFMLEMEETQEKKLLIASLE